MTRATDRLTLLAFLVAVLMLGVNPVGVRLSNRELAPFWGASLRFIATSAVLFGVVALRGVALPRGRALLGAILFGLGQYFAAFALIYWALVAVPAGMMSVVFATLPLWTLFISAAAGFERVRAANVIGGLIAVGGLGIVYAGELTADVPPVRIGAILLAAAVAAATAVVARAFPRTAPVATNAVGSAVGIPLLLALSFLAGEHRALPMTGETWVTLAYLVLSTCVGFVLLVFVILRWTPSAAQYTAVLSPIVTVILASVLAGESFGPGFFAGALVVGAGVYVGAIAGRSAPAG